MSVDALREKQKIFLQNICKLVEFSFKNQIELTCGEFYRSQETQAAHVAAGRSKTMNSMHLKRLAADFNFFFSGRLLFSDPNQKEIDMAIIKKLGDFWESLNTANRWGGNFLTFFDPNHFEMQD